MKVREVLNDKTRELVTTSPSATVHAAMQALITHQISCLPVLDDDRKLLGIVSDKDIFRAAFGDQTGFASQTVDEIMTTELIIGVPEDDLDYISGIMTNNRIRHVPIMDNGRLIGLLSIGDVVKARMKHMAIENRYLREYINGGYPG